MIEFSTVFGVSGNGSVDRLNITNLVVSKSQKKIRVEVANDLTDVIRNLALNQIKSFTGNADIELVTDPKYKKETMNVMVYKLAPEKSVTDSSPEIIGRATAEDMLIGRPIRDSEIASIASINENSGRVTVSGRIFDADEREIKTKAGKEMHIVTFDLTDSNSAITVKLFVNKGEDDAKFNNLFPPIKKSLKKGGLYVVCRGNVKFDDYAKEEVLFANDVAVIPSPPVRQDNAEVKRVELHMHTQMSQMDAVNSAGELIDRAVYWGHKAIALTDHGVVQAYPDAMHASDNNQKIKVIYGVEGYLVDDTKKIVYDITDETVDSPFVVFDIESTGLDKNKCKVIEIGAVKVANGKIVNRWSTFVNPGVKIPKKITDLTSITDSMVKDAQTFAEQIDGFLEFCKGSVMVAHNANFDMGFMKTEAKNCGRSFDLPYLDTMVLARCMYKELPNHRLDTLCKHLGVINAHHHRAVDDAEATAQAFVKMLDELKQNEKYELKTFNREFDIRTASSKTKAFHIILLAKNETGVRNIYEMVSQSHLKYFMRTPRIPKSLLEEKRDGLIIGSACEAGELITAMVEGADDESLCQIAEFYDYLEIQPIGNNAYMKVSDRHPHINTDEDLMDINRHVVKIGEMLNKPVCATCDVHFLDPEGAEYRKILMHYKGFKDADNQAPLYLRTTNEMLEEFSYLGKEKAYEVVVENTNMIADMIGDVRPIPKKKCPPVVDGAEDGIRNDSLRRAEEIYGSPLPEKVQKRLDKELNSIITNGFAVMYRIAQELVRKSLSDGYLVGSRGSVGSSFVAYLSDITEVNSLPAHYICPNCKNVEFHESDIGLSGCDMPDKVCPKCGTQFIKDGHDIPFETFLGFKGNKEPDIDLNFSGDYQPTIHKYTETFFGEGFVFRAGTIGTVAEKTAFGYVKKYCEEKGVTMRNAQMKRLAKGCEGVKRTSGQHPGGIIVVPYTNNIHEFCPVQHPADDTNSTIFTTHFDYHSIDENLLKLDELGHDDPTVIRMLEDLTGVDAKTIPLDDPETMSLFTSNKALKLIDGKDIGTPLGTYGVPEFGTKFVRQMLLDTKPTTFSELARISGLSHGTDVWLGNAQDLIRDGYCDLSHSICARDDIMIYLIASGVEEEHSFKIMESVRKGKGLKPEDEAAMRAANVPEWYIDSCKKIKYMFPKAHAVAYVMMGFRVAWFKVHHPEAYYAAYFTVRADDFDTSTMASGEAVAREALEDINRRKKDGTAAPKDDSLIPILELSIEMYCRGYKFTKVDLYKSDATKFIITPDGLLPPLNALPGLGENAAKAIMAEREKGEFKNVEDLRLRTGSTKSVIEILEQNGCFEGMSESNQVSLFELA
ncbi:MAG: PolC-type DNA polymerase III [Clostridia bacterium]|nr:PolC-type DNA polymerase III [Clostridia bacterium]